MLPCACLAIFCRPLGSRHQRYLLLTTAQVWGDLLMIVMRRKPVQVEQTLLDATRQVLAAPIDAAEWVWFRDNLLSTFVWFAPSPSASDPDRSGTGFVYDSLLAIAREELALQARVADALQFPELHGAIQKGAHPEGT